jgi:hypothetical protein
VRAYTITAGVWLPVPKARLATSKALVDSALAASQVRASLFCTLLSLLANDPTPAISTSQSTTINHLDRRPAGNTTSRCHAGMG